MGLDRQKYYEDLKRREIEFSASDRVFLKVSQWKKLELPPELQHIHDVFHVSMLRRYRSDPSYIISIKEIEVRPKLSFEEKLVYILDRENHGAKETTWSRRTQFVNSILICSNQSSTEKQDEDEDKARGEDGNEDNAGGEDGDEDNDNDDDEDDGDNEDDDDETEPQP
ncbi:rRNA-processing protein EFG1-like [Gossypium hirsutum]|uniref:rRNA-processing protein EFG1-like n=1 Tax=Gossypium hirsutum TaxID=3635 RepID=A0ABM3BW69_GOSHI|nr:rRNA-processing protein EFG1-like [Gossypium hirsutum]